MSVVKMIDKKLFNEEQCVAGQRPVGSCVSISVSHLNYRRINSPNGGRHCELNPGIVMKKFQKPQIHHHIKKQSKK